MHRIFEEKIVRQELSGRPRPAPVVVMFAGQTGAGKSTLASAVSADLQVSDGAVEFSTDELRAYHPRLTYLLRHDVERANPLTDPDARRWVQMAVRYAIEHRYNVLYDGTLSRPDAARETAQVFRDGGYRTAVVFVATPAANSSLSVLTRYQDQVERRGHGRFIHNHDETYDGVLRTADAIDTEHLVDEVRVYRRGGTLLYANELTGQGQWQNPPGLRGAIEAERHRPRTPEEFDRFVVEVTDLADRMDPGWRDRIAAAAERAGPLLTLPRDQHDLDLLVTGLRRDPQHPDSIDKSPEIATLRELAGQRIQARLTQSHHPGRTGLAGIEAALERLRERLERPGQAVAPQPVEPSEITRARRERDRRTEGPSRGSGHRGPQV